MMKAVFEKISKYADTDLPLPVRATKGAAGYDFVVAEDIVVPSFWGYFADWTDECAVVDGAFGLEVVAATMKEMGTKPTLVPTGIKCKLNDGYYLELSVRSSTPLKHWLVLANGVGIIDQDYYGNPDNEGHIYFQMINFSPVDIQLKRGDKIGQGIIKRYELAADDNSTAERKGGFGSTTNI
jgi:dUTP pyrophosphatase